MDKTLTSVDLIRLCAVSNASIITEVLPVPALPVTR